LIDKNDSAKQARGYPLDSPTVQQAMPPKPSDPDPLPDKEGGTTLAYKTYLQLRQDIVSGAFAPGAKLRTRALCETHGVGLAPVREALTRLSREGLVRQIDRRGFAVCDFGPAHLEELTRTRIWLNTMALRASIEYADPTWERDLILAHHRMEALPRYTTVDGLQTFNPQWEEAHARFHLALIAGCRSSFLLDFCSQMFEAMNYYRYRARGPVNVRKQREDEHVLLFRATMERDADKAVALLTSHMLQTRDGVLKRMGLQLPAAGAAPVSAPTPRSRRVAA
jgi:GntR family carbon starvation induced transcriptional regulator